jgi:hypothetical protein
MQLTVVLTSSAVCGSTEQVAFCSLDSAQCSMFSSNCCDPRALPVSERHVPLLACGKALSAATAEELTWERNLLWESLLQESTRFPSSKADL